MTDRRRLTGRPTFVMRVISSSAARIIFSLLGEQWWRERNADGDVIVLEVIQGPVLAWGFLGVRFSSLRDVVVGLAHNLWEGRTRQECQGPHLAEVHREFAHHIVMARRKGQDDRREDGQQEEESGEVEQNQSHNMSAWRWHMECDVRTPDFTTWATRVRVVWMCKHEKVWTCEVCCSHSPSVAADYGHVSCKRSDSNKKNLAKCHFWAALWRSCTTGLSVPCAALSRTQMCLTFHEFFSAPAGIVPLPPRCTGWRWRTDAISGISRKESVRVALLQTHGEDDAILSMLRWSLNGVASVHCVQMCRERSTNSFCIWSTRLATYDRWKSFCASLFICMHTSSVRSMPSCESRNVESFWKRTWILSKLFFDASLSQIMDNMVFNLFFSLPTTIAMRSAFLNNIVRDWEKIQSPSEYISAGLILSQEMPTSAVNDALIQGKKAFWALHFRNCLP